jgi:hypothetical protein
MSYNFTKAKEFFSKFNVCGLDYIDYDSERALEELLFRQNLSSISLRRALKSYDTGRSYFSPMSGKDEQISGVKFAWEYDVMEMGDYFESEDRTYGDFTVSSLEFDRQTALLDVLIKLDEYQSEDELADKIREIFKDEDL